MRLRNALGHPFFQQKFGVSRPVPDINELRAPTDATKLRKRLGFNLYAPSLKKVGGFNVGEKGTVRQHLTITPLVGRTGAISGVPQNFQVLTFGETLFRAFSRRVRMGLDLPSNFKFGGIVGNSRRRVYRFDSSRRGRAGEPRVVDRGDSEPRVVDETTSISTTSISTTSIPATSISTTSISTTSISTIRFRRLRFRRPDAEYHASPPPVVRRERHHPRPCSQHVWDFSC